MEAAISGVEILADVMCLTLAFAIEESGGANRSQHQQREDANSRSKIKAPRAIIEANYVLSRGKHYASDGIICSIQSGLHTVNLRAPSWIIRIAGNQKGGRGR